MAPLPCVVITFPSSSRMISVGMPGEGEGGRRTEKWKGGGGRGEEDEDGEGGERWIEGGWRGEEEEEGEGEQQRRMGGGEEDGGGRGCTCNRKC